MSLAMIDRYREGVVPEGEPDPDLLGGRDGVEDLDGRVREHLDRFEITAALETIWARVRRLNRYVEENRPWDLAKDESTSRQEPYRPRTPSAAGDRLDLVLYNLAEGVRVLALLLVPYMPATSGRLLEALAEGNRELDAFGDRGGGARIDRIAPLFPKLEAAAEAG